MDTAKFIQQTLERVINHEHLLEEDAFRFMDVIFSGEATGAQIGAFLTALRMKGETPEEIAGFARAMREKAARVSIDHSDLVDTCGTGGDRSGTFNISTAAALVAAGAGLPVAKHGNRSVSSKAGSADVLEALGVKLELPPEGVKAAIEEVGIGFFFAPLFHSAMRHTIGPRREMGVRTVFNILGPLTNPAGAPNQLLGVFNGRLAGVMADVLRRLGSQRAIVVHGHDGLDEVTITGPTLVCELKDGQINHYEIDPKQFGMDHAHPETIQGGTAEDNARIVREVLNGVGGPRRDVVLLNAGAAILAGGKADSWADAIQTAALSIDSGRAKECLQALVEFSQSYEVTM